MGLLWYEPNPKVLLTDRIEQAAARYQQRFGEAPNICLVAPSEAVPCPQITVRADRRIQPGYLLIGIERGEDLPAWRPPAPVSARNAPLPLVLTPPRRARRSERAGEHRRAEAALPASAGRSRARRT
ncbi:MAG: hypothetical protein KatS3mg061_0366 [Dehalococcoidia bacterium]|nr:MAG: hypothetical protein KatS3mg061_0366 [Dehalococcoidia bacterium]